MIAYRIGWSIDLDLAASLLSVESPSDLRSDQPLEFRYSPASLRSSTQSETEVDIVATLYEFGGISVRLSFDYEGDLNDVHSFCDDLGSDSRLRKLADDSLQTLLETIAPAVDTFELYSVIEDYWTFEIRCESKSIWYFSNKHKQALLQLASGTQRPLSEERVEEMLRWTLSYFGDEFIFVGWHGSVLIAPRETLSQTGTNPSISVLEELNAILLQLRRAEFQLKRTLDEIDSAKGLARLAGDRKGVERLEIEIAELINEVSGGLETFETEEGALLDRLASERFEVPRRIDVVRGLHERLKSLIDAEKQRLHGNSALRVEVLVALLVGIEVVHGLFF